MCAEARDLHRSPLTTLLAVGTPSNGLLRTALLAIWALLLLKALYALVFVYLGLWAGIAVIFASFIGTLRSSLLIERPSATWQAAP
jgi:hypothetical protein